MCLLLNYTYLAFVNKKEILNEKQLINYKVSKGEKVKLKKVI